MRRQKDPMRVNGETTVMGFVAYISEMEQEFDQGGRIASIPEVALAQIKSEFFVMRDMLHSTPDREIPEIEGDLDGLVVRLTKAEWRALFTFIDHVGKVLRHFEDVGGEIPEPLPPESEP